MSKKQALFFPLLFSLVFLGITGKRPAQDTAENGIIPQPNQQIKVGTKLRGQCHPPAMLPDSQGRDFPDGAKHHSDSTDSEFFSVNEDGSNGSYHGRTKWSADVEGLGVILRCHTETSNFNLVPGHYRMRVTREVFDYVWIGNPIGWREPAPEDRTVTTEDIDFYIVEDRAKEPTPTPTPPTEDLKLIVDADDYDNWIPRGGADEKTAGNDIAVRARLTTKDGKEPKQKPIKIIFELSGTSSQPGVCLNWPAKDKATTDLDLKFDKTNNAELVIEDPKGQRAVSQSGDTIAAAYLSSYDWGAYGTLKVTAEMPDGKIIVGHLKNEGGPSNILLPKRAGNSKIADAWKKDPKRNVMGKPDDDDSERQDGNSNDGDGFTLYEEYRGIMAMGQHQYLDPSKKDLIVEVEDKIGNDADGGLQLFQKAAGINVIKVRYAGEVRDDRVVNFNHGYAHGGDQHELHLIQHTFAMDDLTIGAAQAPGDDVKNLKSPKDCPEIWITDQLSKLSASIGKEGPAVVNASITHEIAHGCSVQHHGDVDTAFAQRDIPDLTWEVYGTDGNAITQRPFSLGGLIGAAHGKASGNVDCIMVYNHYFQWSMPLGVRARVYMAVPPDERPGTIFCRSRTGTGWNAPNHKPYPVFGDAAAGDCMSQFHVKDW